MQGPASTGRFEATDRMRKAFIPTPGRVLSLAAAIAVCALAGASGCSTGQANPAKIKTEFVERDTSGRTIYLEPVPTDARRVNWQNYRLGQRLEAKVRQPVIAVKNYTAADRVMRSVALRDFRQFCSLPKPGMPADDPETIEKLSCSSSPYVYMRGLEGQTFTVAGAFEEDGELYYLNSIDTPDGTLFFATDRTGRLRSERYLSWRTASKSSVVTQFGIPLQVLSPKYPLEFTEPLVRYETEEQILPDSPDYVSYELLYAGTTYDHRGMVYHLLYKEYRRGGQQIPIYTKELAYGSRKTTLDLLGRTIRVYDVDENRIVYAVQQD